MALEINTLRDIQEDSMAKAWTADRRLYMNEDKSKVIESDKDGNPGAGAAFLLCAPGQQVPADLVEQFGLKDKPKAKAKAQDKAVKPAQDK